MSLTEDKNTFAEGFRKSISVKKSNCMIKVSKMAMVKDVIRVYYNASGRKFGYFCDLEHFNNMPGHIRLFVEFYVIFRILTLLTDIYTNLKFGSTYLTVLSVGLNTTHKPKEFNYS